MLMCGICQRNATLHFQPIITAMFVCSEKTASHSLMTVQKLYQEFMKRILRCKEMIKIIPFLLTLAFESIR